MRPSRRSTRTRNCPSIDDGGRPDRSSGGRWTMTDVILFNHALGVTDGVRAFVDRLRAGGHQVTVGDLFQGKTFDDIETGVAYEEEVGWDEMVARSEAAIEPLPPE